MFTWLQTAVVDDAETGCWRRAKGLDLCSGCVRTLPCSSFHQRGRLTPKRVDKAKNLLSSLVKYDDSLGPSPSLNHVQDGSRSYVHAAPLQSESLGKADNDLRHALSRLIGAPLTQTTNGGIAFCGLGAQSAQEHAVAACIASLATTEGLCTHIWLRFNARDIDEGVLPGHLRGNMHPIPRVPLRLVGGPLLPEFCGLPLHWTATTSICAERLALAHG